MNLRCSPRLPVPMRMMRANEASSRPLTLDAGHRLEAASYGQDCAICRSATGSDLRVYGTHNPTAQFRTMHQAKTQSFDVRATWDRKPQAAICRLKGEGKAIGANLSPVFFLTNGATSDGTHSRRFPAVGLDAQNQVMSSDRTPIGTLISARPFSTSSAGHSQTACEAVTQWGVTCLSCSRGTKWLSQNAGWAAKPSGSGSRAASRLIRQGWAECLTSGNLDIHTNRS